MFSKMFALPLYSTLKIKRLEYQLNQADRLSGHVKKIPHNIHHYYSILHNSESKITTMTKTTKPLRSQMQYHANTLRAQIKIHSSWYEG